ncbi:MAG: SWIM zinc finger family protein, partial [Bacteroidota bacterium]
MRKSYGNTWWGKQFLNALQQIDYSNRLPRGKTYANKGAVREIIIKGGHIEAKVKGSRPRPYTQTISLQPFSPKQKKQIVSALLDNPFLLSQLLNRELPPDVEAELSAAGISVFPQTWNDVNARCSCPDYAVPCKHLAAVIYLLANEVDKNPFMVFHLRGLNLLEELEAAGMTATGAMKANVLRLPDLLSKQAPQEAASDVDEALQALDFSRIAPSRDRLLKLLPDRPAFYPRGNFKQDLDKWYKA